MKILPIHPEILRYTAKHHLTDKFEKQCSLFVQNPLHPSLHTELLEPKEMKIWSFRVDKKFRSLFIFRNRESRGYSAMDKQNNFLNNNSKKI